MLRLSLIFSVMWLSACVSSGQSADEVEEALLAGAEQAAEVTDSTTSSTQATEDVTEAYPDDPYYAPVQPSLRAEPVRVTGSLFNDESSRSLYSYVPNFNLGDTITVVLEEEATATKSASSTLGSETSYTLDPITIPGGQLQIGGNVVELGVNQTNDFDGEADANQQHTLSGKITVSVVDVLNNGNLVVRGEKWLVINNGKEFIRLTGIVRPKDVSIDNSIGSYQIANARIEFSGTGEHADTQTQGWLSSLFGSDSWLF